MARGVPARNLHPGNAARAIGKRAALAGLGLVLCTGLTGCFGILKPAKAAERRFVLTPLPVGAASDLPAQPMAVGVGQVKLASYLFDTSLAVRKGTNEIEYLPLVLWAERLGTGLQRALAANLGVLLPTDRLRLSTWRSGDVDAEIYVAVDQFDVSPNGEGVLMARWRIAAPGGQKTLKSGEVHLTRSGPSPDADPAGTIAVMSELVADLSRELVADLKGAAAAEVPGGN